MITKIETQRMIFEAAGDEIADINSILAILNYGYDSDIILESYGLAGIHTAHQMAACLADLATRLQVVATDLVFLAVHGDTTELVELLK